ncbi:MAG: hypothetical protein DRN20_04505 [Thermoplasmata archaeon]|nr:MAG: hypothetical protein DRN20_04505 [Thermoplasmata archaeon]
MRRLMILAPLIMLMLLMPYLFLPAHLDISTTKNSTDVGKNYDVGGGKCVGTLAFDDTSIYKKYAVIVGIGDYPGDDKDIYGDKDALFVYNYLLRCGFQPQNITLLINSNATVMSVTNALTQISSEISSLDEFVFYFSGHGTRYEGQSGIALYDGVLWQRDLKEITDGIDAAKALFVFDSCFSGNFADYLPCIAIGGPNRIVVTSTGDWRFAYGSEEKGGIFTHYFFKKGLAEGLADEPPIGNGNGHVSVEEAFKYAYFMIKSGVAVKRVISVRTRLIEAPRINDQYIGEFYI